MESGKIGGLRVAQAHYANGDKNEAREMLRRIVDEGRPPENTVKAGLLLGRPDRAFEVGEQALNEYHIQIPFCPPL